MYAAASPAKAVPCGAALRLPALHTKQEVFAFWSDDNPEAQCLVAPCGTKSGKSFGSAVWMAKEAWATPNLYCAWISPTYLKARIGYRYLRSMFPAEYARCIDGKLEIYLANGTFIKFLHGQDAEVTVEGEAIDRFVVDEAGKQTSQLWHSLFTTITQTRGFGIITGTPRGFTWYYDIFRKAKAGDSFFVWAQFSTEDSPFVDRKAIEQAKRLLPKPLYDQYYRAMFVSMSTCFGDLSSVWDEATAAAPGAKFWYHPDPAERAKDSCTGVDVAKTGDYTVFSTVNSEGKTVGFKRFRGMSYRNQAAQLQHYLKRFSGDRMVRFDKTGVGVAFEEALQDVDIDATISGVTFTNASKAAMVARTTMAIENNWWRCPRIEVIEHEFASFEVNVTRSGLHSYAAPEGEHDDTVCSFMLSISGAYSSAQAEEAEKAIEELTLGMGEEREGAEANERDELDDYVEAATDFDDSMDDDSTEDDEVFDDLGEA